MRIERLDLDGFGRFASRSWDLPSGLTVLLGPNEAGKTTLLNALRALLFGFEPTRDGRAWYPALAGGRRGGRLQLTTASGERWTVERHGERGGAGSLIVRAPNGNTGGQETLDRILGGADRELFTNIFAFGLGELQSIHSLSGEGVRSRIYGAGTGLGGMSAADLERQVRTVQEATFRPQGRNQELNRLVARIDELGAEIAGLERDPVRFEALHRELVALDAERQRLVGARDAAAARSARAGQLVDAATPAARLTALEAELAADDSSLDTLPPELDRLLAERLAERAAAREVVDASRTEVEEIDARLADIRHDEPALAAAAEITALADERALHATRAEAHAEAVAAAAAAAEELATLARRAGGEPSWLIGLDDSVATLESIRASEARQAGLAVAHERHVVRAQASVDEDVGRGAQDDPVPDAAALGDRAHALRRLVELRLSGAAPAPTTGPAWALPLAGAGVVAIIAWLATLAVAPAIQVPVTLLGALAGAALGWLAGRGVPVPPETADRGALLAAAGLPAYATDADVAAAADEVALARAALTLRERDVAAVTTRKAGQATLERELAEAASALRSEREAWLAWLAEHALPAGMGPPAARQVVELAATARRAEAARRGAAERAAAIGAASTAFEERLDALLARLDRPAVTRPELRPAVVQELVDQLDTARSAARRADDLRLHLAEATRRARAAATRLDSADGALASLLADHGAADPASLEARVGRAAARRARLAEARVQRAELAGVAGGEGRVAELLAEAATTDLAAAEVDRDAAAREMADADAALHELSARAGELRAELTRLEHAAELGERRQELSIVEGRAAARARSWATRAVALRLLEETRRRYERERQPQVIQDAERYLERITGGAYARIIATPGEATVRAEAADGTLRETEELSRGTAEQLYLAMRFGLIEQFSRGAEPLPVVMDDILVNFDAGRADRAAAAIRSLADRHQVIYFTCHPWTASLLDPDGARTVVLD